MSGEDLNLSLNLGLNSLNFNFHERFLLIYFI